VLEKSLYANERKTAGGGEGKKARGAGRGEEVIRTRKVAEILTEKDTGWGKDYSKRRFMRRNRRSERREVDWETIRLRSPKNRKTTGAGGSTLVRVNVKRARQ